MNKQTQTDGNVQGTGATKKTQGDRKPYEKARVVITLRGSEIKVFSNLDLADIKISVLDYDDLYSSKAGSEENKMYSDLEKEIQRVNVLKQVF